MLLQNAPHLTLYDDWGKSAVLRAPQARHYKRIILSDVHLPRPDSNPRLLYEFLFYNTCDELIIAGDFHEGYDPKMADLNEDWLRLFDLIHARKEQGMIVKEIPGNHDHYKRQDSILGHTIFGNRYSLDTIIKTQAGDTLVIHGDVLDGDWRNRHDKTIYQVARNIKIGDKSLVDAFGSFKKLKKFVWEDGGASAKPEFVQAVTDFARERNCTGIAMGHLHEASDAFLMSGDVFYMNSGAWVERRGAALCQSDDGTIRLVDYKKMRKGYDVPLSNATFSDFLRYRDISLAEHKWHQGVHGVFNRKAIIDKVEEAGHSEDLNGEAHEFLRRLSEQLVNAEEAVYDLSRHADIEAPIPSAVH